MYKLFLNKKAPILIEAKIAVQLNLSVDKPFILKIG
jgi:hypothetical protein